MSHPVQTGLLEFGQRHVYDSTEQDLHRIHGDVSKFDRSLYRSICSTSRVRKLDYCQSELSDQVGGIPRSLASLSETSENEKKRLPRKWGSINHDFVVVHMTGKDPNGQELQFCIVAEKIGEGRAGEPAGIYIGVLSEDEIRDLHRNVFLSWDCDSIQVPVDFLVKALWENLDPDYNFYNKNCWDYAKAACKKVLLLLSKQPNLTSGQKSYLQVRAQEVKSSVVTAAALESGARGAMYLVAGYAAYYGIKAVYTRLRDWMEREQDREIRADQLKKIIEADKRKGQNDGRDESMQRIYKDSNWQVES